MKIQPIFSAIVIFLAISAATVSSLEILLPQGGETFYLGDTVKIKWQVTAPEQFRIALSTDDGVNYTKFISYATISTTSLVDSLLWKIPNNGSYVSDSAIIRILPYAPTSTSQPQQTDRIKIRPAVSVIKNPIALHQLHSAGITNVSVYKPNGQIAGTFSTSDVLQLRHLLTSGMYMCRLQNSSGSVFVDRIVLP